MKFTMFLMFLKKSILIKILASAKSEIILFENVKK